MRRPSRSRRRISPSGDLCCRLLSVDQTCRLQRRSLYAYLADVLTAKARGDPVPTLS